MGPARTLRNKDKRDGTSIFAEKLIGGFHTLAEELRTNPKIASVNEIEAISWIVKKYPEWFTFLGFAIDTEPIDESLRKTIFPDEAPGSVYRAHISREELLKKFPPHTDS